MKDKLTKYRRQLHQIPELGFDLHKTYKYVKKTLESFGYSPITYAKTGLVAVKEGKTMDAVAFRADMDALPVTEALDIPFKSKHEGLMHACAHDGHTAMLLGFAEYVSKIDTPNQTIVFIFQPAEEGPGGAKVMIDEGILKNHQVKKIFGLHIFPGLYEGQIGLISGPMLARNAEFNISVYGESSHGAQPQQGIDAVLAASQLVVGLNHIVSRYLNPLEPAVISVGTVNGGEASNIIANKVKISGTMRAFDDKTFEIMKSKMIDTARAIEIQFGVKVKEIITDYYPTVNNDNELFEIAKNACDKESIVYIKPYTFSEDFAFYQKEIPGLFTFIGSRNESLDYVYPLHSNKFNFDEKILLDGLGFYIKVSRALNLF
ncbi:M20 metallopeptidase family protein [Acholeplasma granularum]|uniref:M20 metallopeptidase family protein n=1 Tax=Acholeplasma granularum TaxID=264635 RepID=UPI00046E9317|nr:M20 family metallopeptidase [Acholeplasma granularum]